MLFVIFHLFAGLLTGALFGVQTLFLVVLFLPIAATCGLIAGASIGFSQWVGAGIALQLGYLGGAFLRSMLERFIIGVELHTSGRMKRLSESSHGELPPHY
jgi:hypothetical protein